MPAPAAFLRANIGPIVLLMQAQLVKSTNLDQSRIMIVAEDGETVPRYQGDQDILIRPMGEDEEEGMLEGSGRVDDRRKRQIYVYCRTRVYLDPADQDAIRLTDASLGHFALEDQVANALQIWAAQDALGNILSFPVFVKGPTSAEKMRDDPNWVCSHFTATVEYERNLDQSIQ